MRIAENEIWSAYVESMNLVTEKKGLPHWLKDKKGEKGDKEEKGDKKEKKGKKLPPWLKKKGKKTVKESLEGNMMTDGQENDITVTFTAKEVDILLDVISDKMEYAKDDPESVDMQALEQIYTKLTTVDDTDDNLDSAGPDETLDNTEIPGSASSEETRNQPEGTEKYLP